ncbi:MAG: SMI1/KNR4 family protein [Deltaproteobacteria bacterium]|nr:MAG: SMI1/KNR4 family protein [Deltaproteobacteria bacterium]
MTDTVPVPLPPLWWQAVEWLRAQADGGTGPVWVGEAGFLLPTGAEAGPDHATDVADWLLHRRFPGAHPAFLPFAVDGAGNQFCFRFAPGGGPPSVVYWMYETFAALPISGSFAGFLDWLGLTTAFAARQGLHAVLDELHLQEVVLPTLEALGRTVRYPRFFEASGVRLGDLHRAIVEVDPGAAASHLVLGVLAGDAGSLPTAVERCDRALALVPDFVLAASVRGDLRRDESLWRAHDDWLLAFRGFHGLGGDGQMPWYGGVLPPHDISRLAELLSAGPDVGERSLGEPLWELILYDDPTQPEPWLRTAMEHIEHGELRAAVDMAVNALYFGCHDRLAPEIANLLAELHDALDNPWLARAARMDAERLAQRRPIGEDGPRQP